MFIYSDFVLNNDSEKQQMLREIMIATNTIINKLAETEISVSVSGVSLGDTSCG